MSFAPDWFICRRWCARSITFHLDHVITFLTVRQFLVIYGYIVTAGHIIIISWQNDLAGFANSLLTSFIIESSLIFSSFIDENWLSLTQHINSNNFSSNYRTNSSWRRYVLWVFGGNSYTRDPGTRTMDSLISTRLLNLGSATFIAAFNALNLY